MALLLLSVEAATFCLAQTSNLPFKVLNRQNGLLGDVNAFMFRDSRGFMWVSSLQGLNRFDGKNTKTYVYEASNPHSMRGNNIQSPFFEDKKGDIWFCTEEAINVYRRQLDNFDHFQVQDAKGNLLQNDYYIFDLDASDFLWLRIGNYKNGTLYRFNTLLATSEKTNAPQANHVSEEILDKFNGLRTVVEKTANGTQILSFFWSGKYGIEAYQFNEKSQYIGKQSYFSGQPNDAFPTKDTFFIRQIAHDSIADGFWIASQRGLIFWNKKQAKCLIFNDFNGKQIGTLTDIVVQKDGIWASSRAHGVLFFDRKKQKFMHQTLPNRVDTEGSLLTNFDNIYLDHEDNLWLSSFNNGLFYTNLKRPKFGLLRFPSTAQNVTTDNIIEDKLGNKWIARRGQGIVVVNQRQEIVSNFFTKNLTDFIRRLYRDREGEIWALTTGQSPALYRFNPTSRRFDAVMLAENQTFNATQLYDICQISDGRLLIGSSKGVFELDKSAKNPSLKKCPIIGVNEKAWDVHDIFEDSHKTLYFNQNTQNLLLCRLEGQSIRKIKEVPVNSETASFIEKNNKLWLASNKGLMVFDHGFEDLTAPRQYLVGFPIDGLLNDPTTGHLWLATTQGILKFDPATGNFQRFSMADLMQGYSFGRSALADTEGSFWFGGTNGVNIFKPSDVKNFPFAPRPHITEILVNNKPFRPDSSIIEKKRLILPYINNTVRLGFAAVEFSDAPSDSISYTFNLASIPSEKQTWTTTPNSEDPSVSYVNLSEGDYILQLKAVNSDGVWSDIRTLELHILPPWYRTWWFNSLLFLFILATLYEVVRRVIILREKRLKETADFEQKMMENELKVLRTQMNPHFIFNTLNAIRSYVLKNNAMEASLFLADFAHLMREILNNSTKETISLQKEEEILRGYLEMEQLRFDFDFDIHISDELDAFDNEVPTMILQPFVENAIIHGVSKMKNGHGFIQVRFEKDGDFILCSVEDNGIGMEKSAKKRAADHESKSQQITQERLDILSQLSGKPTAMTFKNIETGGTKVTVRLPLTMR
jgi:ligand-binding sensor domain-containing protein/signal transduction histidine kinase